MSKAYFLRDDSYLRYDVETDEIDGGYPKPIAVGWTGLADGGFDHDVDTVLDLGDGAACLFKGDAYVRIDQTSNRVDGIVLPIADDWIGFADAGFADSLEASVNWGDGKAYFFRDGDYLRYDIGTDSVDAGYPRPVAEAWPGFDAAGFGVSLDAAWLKITPAEGVGQGRASRLTPLPDADRS